MCDNADAARASNLAVSIRSTADIADALQASLQHGGLLITEAELAPAFFELRSGLAGETLQKFVNYGARLAVVVTGWDSHGPRFRELMHEHERHPLIRFFVSEADACAWLSRPPASGTT